MFKRLIINDFGKNRLITIFTCIFMAVTAMLLGLSIFLFARLYSSIDMLMTAAETPHFLQMHTGQIDKEKIAGFAEKREDVEKMQILTFLNLQNSQISIGDISFETNMQDNGLCVQSECFDYLLDAKNDVISVNSGEVYVPVAYRNEYDIKTGDIFRIGNEKLTVAGFLRDSQMNSMMASSKRFLVSESDYERLRYLGSEEYLIEFRLKEGSDISAFDSAYKDMGLYDNGPTITYPLIKLMNALSDGIMILVILLVSIVVLIISILCIRYILLTELEKDMKQIGMMKAVGISRKDIGYLYISKYMILSVIGCITGMIFALIIAGKLAEGIRDLYGEPKNALYVYILMLTGSFAGQAVILLSVRQSLSKTRKLSAVAALAGATERKGKKNMWHTASVIVAASVFMILVPLGMKNTMAAPDFVTYMGIGNSHIRADIRQNDIKSQTDRFIDAIKKDERVDRYSLMQTSSYKVRLENGNTYNLMIENGDHGAFPVNYSEGAAPKNENEIALSILNAEEMDLGIGDKISVFMEKDGTASEYKCVICGIYSDITNGGKSAKACLKDDTTPIMWSIIYISLKDEGLAGAWVNEYKDISEGLKIVRIREYLEGMYGTTIRNISNASFMTVTLSGVIIMVVIMLLMRLIIWKERSESSLKKALGLRTLKICTDYLKKLAVYVISGIFLGVLTGVLLGQRLAGTLLGMMGAQGFKFVIDPLSTFIYVPVFIALSAFVAAFVSLREIKRISASECLNSGLE
ncbi:MAG: ABC transporter permease [Lachnospiraceae bacterium]|nr:ABC transporter permease [Lachnospiraceae bacterium]